MSCALVHEVQFGDNWYLAIFCTRPVDKMEGQQIRPGGSIKGECNNSSFIRLVLSLDY
jgi:hypothetical protein